MFSVFFDPAKSLTGLRYMLHLKVSTYMSQKMGLKGIIINKRC